MRRRGRIALDQLGIGLGRRPERHELARRAAAAGVDEGRGVAHRAGVAALDRDEAGQVRHAGASEKTPRETFSPILPLTPAGMRIEPPPSVACEIGSTPAATMAAVPADEPQVV